MAVPSEILSYREKEPLLSRYAIGVAGQGGTSTGSVYAGMYEASPAFRRIFDRAEDVLEAVMPGFSIQKLCFEDNPENQKTVEQTLFSHLANTTIYVAKYEDFAEEYSASPLAEFILPQSAGEAGALAISGMTSFEDALLIAKKRGELTEKAASQTPGKMVYVAGIHGGFEELDAICRRVQDEMGGVVAVSNRNSPKELIYSGQHALVDEVTKILDRKVIELPISFASHCALMEPMVEEYVDYLSQFTYASPSMRWILNGDVVHDPEEIVQRMAWGPTRIVDYQSSVEELARMGINSMVEMTPNVRRRSVVGRYAANTVEDFNVILR